VEAGLRKGLWADSESLVCVGVGKLDLNEAEPYAFKVVAISPEWFRIY
jgi:hypothetical protein